jgi:hypothetical protein
MVGYKYLLHDPFELGLHSWFSLSIRPRHGCIVSTRGRIRAPTTWCWLQSLVCGEKRPGALTIGQCQLLIHNSSLAHVSTLYFANSSLMLDAFMVRN